MRVILIKIGNRSYPQQRFPRSFQQVLQRTYCVNIGGRFTVSSRGVNESRGRYNRFFVNKTGKNDPYGWSAALMNIYENLVVPVG